MAYNFSANQFEKPYLAKRLGNWELPKWHPPHPRQRKGSTKIISDDNGHIQPIEKRTDKNPWGKFRSTYELPDKLTRRFGEEYNESLIGRDKWNHFPQKKGQLCEDTNNNLLGVRGTSALSGCKTKCETAERILSADKTRNRLLNSGEKRKKSLDLEYIPGDFTAPQQQHYSRKLLLDQKYERDNAIEPELPLDKLYLGDHECNLENLDDQNGTKYTPPLPETTALTAPFSPPQYNFTSGAQETLDFDLKMPNSITGKPNERCPSPIIPAYANFELAKRMHQDNLDHQPLPDCVADLAYRKLQISGGHAGLALDIDPIATGVGVRTHNAGPTHCTKMKVFRPKTCGVVPKAYNNGAYRPISSMDPNKKMGAMDLAICWDYKPSNPADEPQRPRHIDGSNESSGPAVFTFVKTPRDDPVVADTGRSAGVFTNTLGETGFFDKDIMRRKTDFTGRNNIERDSNCGCGVDSDPPPRSRIRSVSRDCNIASGGMPNRFGKQYQSSPNIMSDQQYKSLRDKYLPSDGFPTTGPACKRSNPGFFRRATTRLCHKVAPEPDCCNVPDFDRRSMHCNKTAFRAGVPKYNAAGHFVSSDSGCSMRSSHSNRVLVVPRPRNPYAKKNYDIETLVPPFSSYGGGAGQGGYPEHWRLATCYQHSYKPIEQRRRPMLQTVYK